MDNNHSDDEMPPDLDDFTEELEKAKLYQKQTSNDYVGDYTEIKKEPPQQNIQPPQKNNQINKAENQQKQVTKKTEPKKSSGGGAFGFKKGFLKSSTNSSKKSEPKITTTVKQQQPINKVEEVKAPSDDKKQNKWEIPEVQAAMNLQNNLLQNKEQWLTPDLLTKISQNEKLAKLFTNPEYMQAITLMQTNPDEAKRRYGNNPEFQMLFQEFCKVMGYHFTELSAAEKEQQKQEQEKAAQENMIKKTQNLNNMSQEERITYLMQNDEEVKAAMQDQKVQKFIQYLQTNQKVDFHAIMRQDQKLSEKLKILIDKGILNIQRY